MYPGTFADSAPDRPAVIMGDGQVVTYRELDAGSNRFAQFLVRSGFSPGDVIAVLMENNARYHEVCWGARRIGLYFVTINSHLNVEETAYILNDSGARAIVSSEQLSPLAAALTPDLVPGLEHRLMIGVAASGWDSYDEIVGAFPAERVDLSSKATSCSTPRGPPDGPRASSGRCATRPYRRRPTESCRSCARSVSAKATSTSRPRRSTTPPHLLVQCCSPPRRHGGRDGEVRRGAGARADRRVPRHALAVRSDDVRADAEAARAGTQRS